MFYYFFNGSFISILKIVLPYFEETHFKESAWGIGFFSVLAQTDAFTKVKVTIGKGKVHLKNVNFCLNTNIYSYLETSVACIINIWRL
jgi:hypothetical protein